MFVGQMRGYLVATVVALHLRLHSPGLAMKRKITVNCPLVVAVANYLSGTKPNLAKFFAVQDLRPEHCGLNFCSVLFRGIGISNSQASGFNNKPDSAFLFVESTIFDWGPDFVVVPKRRKQAALVNANC